MDRIDWSRISLAVWGDSAMARTFVARFRQRYPGVRVFDRHAELKRQATATHVLCHLEVADIDAVFYDEGHVEHAVIRCLGRHRSFNYVPGRLMQDKPRLDILLRRMIDVIPWLLAPRPQAGPAATGEDGQAETGDASGEAAEQEKGEDEVKSAGS